MNCKLFPCVSLFVALALLLASCGPGPTPTLVPPSLTPAVTDAPTPTASFTPTPTATPTPTLTTTPTPTPTPLPPCAVDRFAAYQRLLCAPAEVTDGKVRAEWLRWCLGHYGYALKETVAEELPLVTASPPDGQCTYQAIEVAGVDLPYVGGVLLMPESREGSGIATVTPTPTATAMPTSSLAQKTTLYAGPALQGYKTIATLKAGTNLTLLATFGDFVQVQARVGEQPQTGFILKKDIGALPSSLPELEVDAVPWQPVDVVPNFFDPAAALKNDVITINNTGHNGYYDYHGRPFTFNTAFRVTVKLHTSDRQFGSLKLQDRPNVTTGPWWKGIRRLDIATDGHKLYIEIHDGVVEAPKHIDLGLPDSQVVSLIFSDPNGRAFSVIDGNNRKFRTVDVTRLGLQLPQGLFPQATVYIGCVTSPKSKLTIGALSVEKAPSGKSATSGTTAAPIGLRPLAKKRGITVGTEFSWWWARNPKYWEIMSKDFDVAILSEFSSQDFWRGRGQYNFERMDNLVDWIIRCGWQVRASHLVWGAIESKAVPDWLLKSNFSRDEYIQILREHVRTVVGHYKGRVAEWSIANEAGSRSFWNGADFWNDKIGPEYIEIAFRAAKEADPGAILIFNDDNNQSPQDEGTTRVIDRMYATVKDLKSKGVPIDVVGMQMHLLLPWNSQILPDKAAVIETMRMFAELGVDIYITEFDVNLQSIQGSQKERWDLEAKVYRDMMEACLESGVCKSFATWGISDSTSWITCTDRWWCVKLPNADPLMFDKQFRPKPAYYAVRDALLGE